tara:strand:+ start:127 stop:318 length:192 start_codon:yes stop_codon:yes gene_type:complete
MSKPKLTLEQKKALAAYNEAMRQEDRYLGSVFVTPSGQREIESLTQIAYQKCKGLGMTWEHGL